MTAVDRILGMLAATLPPPVRDRYREEWLADAAGSRELGMAPVGVVAGALSTVVRIDRTAPSVSGMPKPALAARRARWGIAILGSSTLLTAVLWLAGATFAADLRSGSGLAVPGSAALAIGIAGIVVGLLVLMDAVAILVPGPRIVGAGIALAAVPVAVVVLAFAGASVLLLGLLAAAGAGVVAVAVIAIARPRAAGTRRGIGWSSAGIAVVLVVMTAVGVLHVAVWNPLAKVPGLTLDEIYAGLAAAGENPSPTVLAAWAAGGVASALAIVLAATPIPRLRARFSTRRLVVVGLLAIAGTACSVWFAGFSHGMSIADTFMTSGGDAVGASTVLAFVGLVAGIPGIVLAVAPGPRPS